MNREIGVSGTGMGNLSVGVSEGSKIGHGWSTSLCVCGRSMSLSDPLMAFKPGGRTGTWLGTIGERLKGGSVLDKVSGGASGSGARRPRDVRSMSTAW